MMRYGSIPFMLLQMMMDMTSVIIGNHVRFWTMEDFDLIAGNA
jgi:hypothetical protein